MAPRRSCSALARQGYGFAGHDAVVGAPGAGAVGAGAVAGEHLRGGPAVELQQVALRAAPLEPGVAEVVPEPAATLGVFLTRKAGARDGASWHAIAVKVMISSVRKGLEAERDALPGLILALGHQPVRFEDFGAAPRPSREVCLRAVLESDVYLLLLGPHYGQVFPETGQSATHDEFVAAQAKGIPRIVLKKTGVVFDAEQQAFAKLLRDYGSGISYDTFAGAADIQAKVVRALRQVQDQPDPLAFTPLPAPVSVEWRRDWPTSATGTGLSACLEVHIVPVPSRRLSAREMNESGDHLLTALRASGAVPAEAGLESIRESSGAAVIRLLETRRRFDEVDKGTLRGVRLAPSSQVSLWYTLPRGRMPPAVLDPDDLAARIAEALRLAGRLRVLNAPHVAIAAGIDPASLTTIGSVSELATRSSASFAGGGRLEYVHLEPDEAATAAALDSGAAETARSVARRLIGAVS